MTTCNFCKDEKNEAEKQEQLDCKENTTDPHPEPKDDKTHEVPQPDTQGNATTLPPPPPVLAFSPAKRPPQKSGWQFKRGAEFPWRLEQPVHQDSNWRGTWTLEVKDMQAMVWESERVLNESGRPKYQRTPTWQLPFVFEPSPSVGPLSDRFRFFPAAPAAGGQDDLMVWLGKP
jgi:hypothetical protein